MPITLITELHGVVFYIKPGVFVTAINTLESIGLPLMGFHHKPKAVTAGAAVGRVNAIGMIFPGFGLQGSAAN